MYIDTSLLENKIFVFYMGICFLFAFFLIAYILVRIMAKGDFRIEKQFLRGTMKYTKCLLYLSIQGSQPNMKKGSLAIGDFFIKGIVFLL